MPRFRNLPVDVVIDVRSRLEFWLGHLPSAICLPVGSLAQAVADRGIARDARVLVYCASGARSAQAAAILRQLGYKRVTDGGAMAAARGAYQAD
jgi:rhodanese-related sulfurtransferase